MIGSRNYNIIAFLLLALFVSFIPSEAATKGINTKLYKSICAGRTPVEDNDKRGHAILKLSIEASTLHSILSRETPQHKATCWLLYDDPRRVDPRGNKAKYLERYALVTFYVNSKGPGWSRSDHWLSKESECNWYGITCSNNLFESGKHVVGLDLSFNKVEGIIPAELGYLKQLKVLDLNGNSLQGVLPTLMFRNLTKLKKLHLHMNDLFGAIPKEIGLLKNLKELTLFGNFFFGKIPSEISNLKKLKNLDLYANNLTGSVPASIAKLKNLKEFYVNDNEVVGRMPNEICKMKLEHLVSDCLGARPEVPCECCSICCQGLPEPKCKDMRAVKKRKVKK
mmetsp:Transcript_428/g.600  ORF Transcript_428/g.600 Transcript_428/m.600 type:complete len:338 (+) Transcript_428:255-1268(+)